MTSYLLKQNKYVSFFIVTLPVFCIVMMLFVGNIIMDVFAFDNDGSNGKSDMESSVLLDKNAPNFNSNSVIYPFNEEPPVPDTVPPTGSKEYDYLTVDENYFCDAVFLGDSLTQSLLLYSGIPAISYAYKGGMITEILDSPLVETENGKITVEEALSKRSDFTKIYILFGLNEQGWTITEDFAYFYGTIIDRLLLLIPEGGQIYIQSVLPVSQHVNDTHKYCRNAKIQRMNELLKEVADEKGVVFLNVWEIMADENGVLPKEASADGIHPTKKYIGYWYDYLKTHAVINEEDFE